jgi:hypothetical protein
MLKGEAIGLRSKPYFTRISRTTQTSGTVPTRNPPSHNPSHLKSRRYLSAGRKAQPAMAMPQSDWKEKSGCKNFGENGTA